METEDSLLCSQQPISVPYPEPGESVSPKSKIVNTIRRIFMNINNKE
jgi:hypothetical protein